jgi:hypothetical protein
MVFLVTATATVAVEYCPCFVVLGLSVWCSTSGERCALGYLLVLVLLPESFYLAKVMVLGGGCVPMVG